MFELEELAGRAGPAIENARRFREARQLADLDALTGLHNRRYFHETLAARGRARPPLQPPARPDRLRPRRLQGDQRPDRAPRRRRGPRRGGGPRPRRRPLGRHRLPRRRRRVRGDPAGVDARRRRAALPPAARGDLVAGRSAAPGRLQISAGIAELRRDDDAVALLRAGRRGALPREGGRQGPGRRGDAAPPSGRGSSAAERGRAEERARTATRSTAAGRRQVVAAAGRPG